ncbi:hypothetical protein FACS1894202_09830 [Clostridia bacterium]|nr:hypothetical protein FACS1894202_09830 [Clostridia bacterium]
MIGYVTIAKADKYVAAAYAGTATFTAWNAITTSQKTLRLMNAYTQIEAIPMRPYKPDIPYAVKAAQIEAAVSGLVPDEADKRSELQRQGMTAFSLGDLSESYGKQSALASAYPTLSNSKVARLLSLWLNGGFPTC